MAVDSRRPDRPWEALKQWVLEREAAAWADPADQTATGPQELRAVLAKMREMEGGR